MNLWSSSFQARKRVGIRCTVLLAAMILLSACGSVSQDVRSASPLPEIHAATAVVTERGAATTRRRIVKPKVRQPVLLPVVDQNDINAKHKALADQVLRALPSTCRQFLQNFYVLYGEKGKNRGLGGASTIIVTGNVKSSREFMALVTHECGHVADLGGLTGSPSAGTTAYIDGSTMMFANDPSVLFYAISWDSAHSMKARARERDFVSGYALSDAFEDFAETYAYYFLQRKEFKRLAEKNPVLKAKYDFMQQVVFTGIPEATEGKHVRGSRAPWDVTKLPYEWHAKQ